MLNKNKPTVCILTAGKGTRVGKISEYLNKSLLPINKKAAISWIIEKFPFETEFIIGIGFFGEQVKEFLKISHPNNNFKFVSIENFDGIGSGPGHSLMCCMDLLQKPFYFVACDTLWDDELNFNLNDNWFGVSKINSDYSNLYCNFKVEDNHITGIKDKENVKGDNFRAFTGLAFINDYKIFWKHLSHENIIDGEKQISDGINGLIKNSKCLAVDIKWNDIGDFNKYSKMVKRYENFDFSKFNESIYIYNNKVIKFFSDSKIIEKRVLKASLNTQVFPNIKDTTKNFYSYEFLSGETLYEKNSKKIFINLLGWLSSNLWKKKPIEPTVFKKACVNFYKNKTLDRIKMYEEKYNKEVANINGEFILKSKDLLNAINWNLLCDGIPTFIHGDLQFDNILLTKSNNEFCLIDWRQDFDGYVEFGDLYYDLSKLYGGIILNYDLVKKNIIDFNETDDEIFFDFAQRFSKDILLECFQSFIKNNKYDLFKIKTLVGLIYLNMSPLHHYPFDKLLNALGRVQLNKELLTKNIYVNK